MEDDGLKQTVVVVHGTFDAVVPGVTKWYQPGGAFCEALDRSLAELDSTARCWAHCAGRRHPIFAWDGGNDWKSRRRAAEALRVYLKTLGDDGWRCHLVSHSHGGNIIVRALEDSIASYLGHNKQEAVKAQFYWQMKPEKFRLTHDSWYETTKLGEIVCMGTPFLDLPQFNRSRGDRRGLKPTSAEEGRMMKTKAIGALGLAVLAYVLWTTSSHSDLTYRVAAVVSSLLLWLYVGFELILFLLFQLLNLLSGLLNVLPIGERDLTGLQARRGQHERDRPTKPTYLTHLLAQNSPHDEARILLRTFEPSRLVFRKTFVTAALQLVSNRFKIFTSRLRAATQSLLTSGTRGDAISSDAEAVDGEQVDKIRRALVVGLPLLLAAATLLAVASFLTGRLRTDLLALMMVPALIAVVWAVTLKEHFYQGLLAALAPLKYLLTAVVLQYVAVPVSYSAARRAAHGLQDYPHIPDVVVGDVPFWHDLEFSLYEDIPPNVASGGLDRRRLWLDAMMVKIPKVAADGTFVADLLRDVVGDPASVHSSYYLSTDNASRVARFLTERQ